MSTVEPEMAALIRQQHGVISRVQALQWLTPTALRHQVESGRWERVAPSTYGIAHHRQTWIRGLWIAQLHAGPLSVVSHQAAGRCHRVPQVPSGHQSLIVPRACRKAIAGVTLHHRTDLAASDVVVLDGLRVTSVARTVVDLAAVLHIATLRVVVEWCILERRASVAEIGATLQRVRRHGRNGVSRLCVVLDDVGSGDSLPRSELERLLDEVIVLADLPEPVHEFPLPGRGAVEGFVDRCWPEIGLIVEADGRRWHSRHVQAALDATRRLESQAAGYDTTALLWEHLRHDPEGTASLLREVYLRRARAA